MSDGKRYSAIHWNTFKKHYDLVLIFSLASFLVSFFLGSFFIAVNGKNYVFIQLLIRVLGAAAFTLLVFILSIGPLARLFPSLHFLLYNRRHLGVTLFLIAFLHGTLSILWYNGFSIINPFVSLFTSNLRYNSLTGFPYEVLGFFALLLLLILAVTSHDFWLKTLSPVFWKSLHMGVYLAYALLVAHIMLGVVQSEASIFYPGLVFFSILFLSGLHIISGIKSFRIKVPSNEEGNEEGWICFGSPYSIPKGQGKIISSTKGQRIAVFRYGNKISAIRNACAHQNGPLGEGRVIDGCITCPWHGHQFAPENGRAPAPFTDRIPTYQVKMLKENLYIKNEPEQAGTYCKPVILKEEISSRTGEN